VMALDLMPFIDAPALDTAALDTGGIHSAAAALGVFAGFEVTNFDVFLVCHNTSFAVLGLVFALCQ